MALRRALLPLAIGLLLTCAFVFAQTHPTLPLAPLPPVSFGASLRNIDLFGLLLAVVLSSLSGLTALLNHMRREYLEHGKIDNIWLFVTSKITGSNLAGLIVFFYAPEHQSLTTGNIAVLIILAAFGGTWFVERLLQALVSTIQAKGKA